MNVPVGLWRSFPKEMRLLMLESVAEYQAEQKKKAAERGNAQTA